MIFKKGSKLFWFEAFVYLVIIAVCMLGSFGVFDTKAHESDGKVDTCIEWVNVPSDLRVKLLRFGMLTEMRKAELGEVTEPLIDCLSNYMQDLDKAIVDECGKDTKEAVLDEVFDNNLERVVFRCMKWVNEEKE